MLDLKSDNLVESLYCTLYTWINQLTFIYDIPLFLFHIVIILYNFLSVFYIFYGLQTVVLPLFCDNIMVELCQGLEKANEKAG